MRSNNFEPLCYGMGCPRKSINGTNYCGPNGCIFKGVNFDYSKIPLCENCKSRQRTFGKNPKTKEFYTLCSICYKNRFFNKKCINCNQTRKYGGPCENIFWKYCGGNYCKNLRPRCNEKGCHNLCILASNNNYANYCDGNHCIKYSCNQTGCHNKAIKKSMWCSYHN